jgi:hypothetical protein
MQNGGQLMKSFTDFISVLAVLFFSMGVSAQEYRTQINKTHKNEGRIYKKEIPKNAVSLELMGRGFLYGIGYDRKISNDIAVGASISYVMISLNPGVAKSRFQTLSLPLYGNYYFYNKSRHKLVATGGLNLFAFEAKAGLNDGLQAELSSSSDSDTESQNSINIPELELSGSGLLPIPQAGIGYEYSAKNGFLARANLYGMYAVGAFIPWVGVSAGFTF